MNVETLDQLTIALDPAAQAMLAGAIIIMIFAIALGLKPAHFSFLRSDPKLFWGGLAAQLIGLPVMTLALVTILSPAPSIALGMIVVAACPGGNVSNFMTWSARGDTAYSVSLTAGSSIIAALWTPAAILLWSGLYQPTSVLLDTIEFSRVSFVMQTTLMLAAPLGLGMAAAHYYPRAAGWRGDGRHEGSAVVSWTVETAAIARGHIEAIVPTPTALVVAGWMLIFIPVAIHNAAAFALGAASGRLLGANDARRRTLTFEVGIQNAGLAVVLLLAQLKGLGGAAAIAAVWGVWHFFSGGVMILLYRTIDARTQR